MANIDEKFIDWYTL